MLKVNGLRAATIADLEHAEAVMGAAPDPLLVETLRARSDKEPTEGIADQDRQFAHFQCGCAFLR